MTPNFPVNHTEENDITFSIEDVAFLLEDEKILYKWLRLLIERMEKELHSLNFIFCSDEFLYKLNVEFLDHDTLTDVITFYYSPQPVINGEIYISIDRVKENASKYKVSFLNELHRVMAHGLLHLIGFGDKSEEDIVLMRNKENEALELLTSMFNETGEGVVQKPTA